MIFRITPRVIFETQRIFGEKLATKILETFLETDFHCNYENEVERIQLAILHGSKANINEFDNYIKLSKIDYRDVLMSSGLGNENWKKILIDSGFKSLENKHFNIENRNKFEYESKPII